MTACTRAHTSAHARAGAGGGIQHHVNISPVLDPHTICSHCLSEDSENYHTHAVFSPTALSASHTIH